jgi:MYXO-CTERM domain-containing protein
MAVTLSDLQASSNRQPPSAWLWAVLAAAVLGAGRLMSRKQARL